MTKRHSFKQTVLALAQRGTMRSLATQLLSAAVVLLFSAVMLFGLNIATLRHAITADRRADLTVEQLYEAENHLLAIELTIRGYALTGDAMFLTYYQIERGKLEAAIKPLRSLTAGLPDHELHLKRVLDTIRVRTDTLTQLMRLAPNGPAKVGAAIRDPKIRNTMRAARYEIGAMRDMELKHRETLASAAEEKFTRDNFLAGGILIVSLVVGVLGLFFAFFGGPAASSASGRPYLR